MPITQEEKNRVSRLRRAAKKQDYTLNIVNHGTNLESRRIMLTNNQTEKAAYFSLNECEEFLKVK